MPDTFSPPVPPDSNGSVKHEPKVLEAKMGDGAVQRAGDGINSDLPKSSWKWTNLYKAEADYILAFFADRKGYIPFLWKRPTDATARLYVCKTWDENWKTGKYCDITASFERTI